MLSEGYKWRVVEFYSTMQLQRHRRRMVPRSNRFLARNPGTRDSVCDPDHRSIRCRHLHLDDLPLFSNTLVGPCLNTQNNELLKRNWAREKRVALDINFFSKK